MAKRAKVTHCSEKGWPKGGKSFGKGKGPGKQLRAKGKRKASGFVPVCFGCGEKGHVKPRCPKANQKEVRLCEKVDRNQFESYVKYD